MTSTDYTQNSQYLDALENALVLLSERLNTAPAQDQPEDVATLRAEISRLEENQAAAQAALNEATQIIRQMLDNSKV